MRGYVWFKKCVSWWYTEWWIGGSWQDRLLDYLSMLGLFSDRDEARHAVGERGRRRENYREGGWTAPNGLKKQFRTQISVVSLTKQAFEIPFQMPITIHEYNKGVQILENGNRKPKLHWGLVERTLSNYQLWHRVIW